MNANASLIELMQAIALRDGSALLLLESAPGLARETLELGATRQDPAAWFLTSIQHQVYEGDTALHVAAASYDGDVVAKLLELGAGPSAANRRGAHPVHYAADGNPNLQTWDPAAQVRCIGLLIRAGANPNTWDKNGTGPLHRAVRNRCSAAVRALIDGGADPHRPNSRGSTALQLARQATGRGGSGSPQAVREQAAIVELLSI